MKRFKMLSTAGAVVLLVLLGVGLIPKTALAAVPQLINFMGKLSTPSGDTVSPGSYNVTFRIWDAASGGTELWNGGSQAVNVAAGLFNTLLSAPEGIFNGDQRWLGITVAPDVVELAPRTQIVSVGFSYRVGSVDGASGGTITSKVSIGPGHTNTGTSAFVAGENNTASGNWSTVGGGGGLTILESNSALGAFSTVSGGTNNTAGGDYSAISGGQINTTSGFNATVGGGASNSAGGDNATVGGGFGNTASGIYSTMGGGRDNIAADTGATVGGGRNNRARGWYSTVGGGGGVFLEDSNSASGDFSAIGGGVGNAAGGLYSTVGGGNRNIAGSPAATVAGGTNNQAISSYATVAGGIGNRATRPYSTIGGGVDNDASGNYSTLAGGQQNNAFGFQSFVGGGWFNYAGGDRTTVGGGQYDSATGEWSTVSGGFLNRTAADGATVPGGIANNAAGSYSFAAGFRANALHEGSFVWSDHSVVADFASSAANEFNIRAAGGTRIYSNSGLTAGVTLAAGASAWVAVSDSNLKRNIRTLDGKEMLEKVIQLPIKRWSYKAQDPSIEHIGPMAQDFYPLFQVGDDDKTISTIDPPGIALAAIQGLYQIVEEQKRRIEYLEEKLKDLQAEKPKAEIR